MFKRWLPVEILQDIGFTKADEMHDLVIIKDLASSESSTALRKDTNVIISLMAGQPTPTNAPAPPEPQIYQLESWGHNTNSNTNARTTESWAFMSNRTMLHQAINRQRFGPAKQRLVNIVLLPAKHSSRGTGVFLPYTEHHVTRKPKPRQIGSPDMKPCYNKRQCQQKQWQQLPLYAHALTNTHEQQASQKNQANAESNDCPNELGLPQEWIY
ncbi:hypothetical protein ACP70R_014162 [Stipagrostis hirtigluma subsp. patula]